MHSRSDCFSAQSSKTRLFDDMMLSHEDKAVCTHSDDDEQCLSPRREAQVMQNLRSKNFDGSNIHYARPVQYHSSSSSSSSASSIVSSSGDDWDSFHEKDDKEYDSATILDFPFDLLEDDYSTGDILFSLDDILWNDSTETKEAQLDCALDSISRPGLSSTESPPVVQPLNMDKLDECMQRSAESRSMIKKMAAAMLPTPWSAFETMSVVSDDCASVCLPECPQNPTTDLRPCSDALPSPSVLPAAPAVVCEMKSIQAKPKKSTRKTKRAKKTTKTYKKRSPSEYICSGVLLKRVIPKFVTHVESRDICGNGFSQGSEATKTMIHKILLQKKVTESVSPLTAPSTQSISSFLRQHKKPLYGY